MGLKTGLTLLSLLGFGILYNWLVGWLERTGYEKCYVSLLVVVGVAITGLGFGAITGWANIVPLTLCFVASGAPMVAGSVARYVRWRAETDAQVREGVRDFFGKTGD